MTDNPTISGEEFETLFLGLNEEEFVERVVMINWRFECSRGMTYGHRQEDHILPFEHGNHVTRIERALSLARWMISTVFRRISQTETALT